MNAKYLIPAALALLALLAATPALADYEFEGEADGQCGTIEPWANWEGTLHTGETPYFEGTWWWLSFEGTIFGWAEYDRETDCYYVEEGDWDCNEAPGLFGKWEGYFCPSSEVEPKAWGTWWATGGLNCDGELWGTVVE